MTIKHLSHFSLKRQEKKSKEEFLRRKFFILESLNDAKEAPKDVWSDLHGTLKITKESHLKTTN